MRALDVFGFKHYLSGPSDHPVDVAHPNRCCRQEFNAIFSSGFWYGMMTVYRHACCVHRLGLWCTYTCSGTSESGIVTVTSCTRTGNLVCTGLYLYTQFYTSMYLNILAWSLSMKVHTASGLYLHRVYVQPVVPAWEPRWKCCVKCKMKGSHLKSTQKVL